MVRWRGKVLKGRQNHKQDIIKQVTYSVALPGLTIVRLSCPGGSHPRLWSFAPPVLFTGHQLLNYWHYLLHRLVSFVFLPKIYCIVDCCMAMQQLLCRDAAIALSRCSNELPSRNRATERIKKAVISLLSGKSKGEKLKRWKVEKVKRWKVEKVKRKRKHAHYDLDFVELANVRHSLNKFGSALT